MSTDVVIEESNLYTIITAASSVVLLAAYYIFNVAHKPKIYAGNTILRSFLDKHLPSLKDKYYPSWFSWEGRLQSALGLNLRISPAQRLPYRREILRLNDGGQLAVDFLGDDNEDNDKLVVLLLPGLTSSSNTSYVKTLAMAAVNSGATVAVFNNRGIALKLTTPRTYCATNSDDIREVIIHLKTKYPNSKFLAIGTSLGGMMLSRYLINYPVEAKETFVTSLLISICWDPLIGNASLEQPFLNKYIINYTLTSNLQNLVRRHQSVLESRDCWDFEKIFNVKTIMEFDHHFTAPQFGYDSAFEYYKAAQISPEIHKFSIPVFGLNSIDDPMQPGEDLPIKQAEELSSKLALIVTERGGHLGWIDGLNPFKRKPFHYMERIVGEFIEAVRLHSDELVNNNYECVENKSFLIQNNETQ